MICVPTVAELTDDEQQHLLQASKIAFDNTTVEFDKKTIAEHYISMNTKAVDIFLYYADYLISDDKHEMLTKLIEHGINSLFLTSDPITSVCATQVVLQTKIFSISITEGFKETYSYQF